VFSGKQTSNFVFNVVFGPSTTHELDAVHRHEWRVLPLTRWMSEHVGMSTFIPIHVPLFAGLASVCWAADPSRRRSARRVFSSFSLVHVGLHWLFRIDRNYEFRGFVSNGLILGAGLAGALFLALNRSTSAGATSAWNDEVVGNS
jgi:hypothetical protein